MSIVFIMIVSVVYAQENLEELRADLLAQEQQMATGQKAGNKGYIYSGGVGEVKKKQPVYQTPGVERKVIAEEKPPAPLIPSAETELGPGNKGYVYSSGTGEVKEGSPVYILPSVQEQIRLLYKDANILFREGKFEEARANLEEIIKLNPLHIPARHLIKRIVDKQTELSFEDAVIDTKEKMLDVDKAWLPPARKGIEEAPLEVKLPVKTPQQKIMEEKANQIIPEINFTDAHIRDVLKYLSDISGINIVIDEDIFPKVPQVEAVPGEIEVTETGEEGMGLPTIQEVVSDRITISLINIPLVEALKYILSAKGLKYRIDEYAIVVSIPERLAAVEMETCYYHLSAGVGIFTEFAKKVKEEEKEAGAIARGLKEEAKITIKDVLEESGVPFPPGSKVFLDKRTGTLIVRNTPQNLRLTEEVLRILDITPFQVEIEARFVELKQEATQELGLEWMITSSDYRFGWDKQFRWDNDTTDVIYGQYPDPLNETGREGVTHGLRYLQEDFLEDSPYQYRPKGNILSISGVLSKPEFRMILHALDQSGYTNVLSSPKVTTLNNQQAQIEVVREIIYPTEFELTPATTNDAGTVVTQPVVTPVAWTTRDVGIILNVTPSVGADNKTINLNLKPEVSQFKRWEDYGISAGSSWAAIPIKQPIFFTQNVETNVVIHDGETVVLGGLIKEESESREDKIPLLGDIPIVGRLFRSNSETTEKTNLLIFVTTNLLTPTGERIRK